MKISDVETIQRPLSEDGERLRSQILAELAKLQEEYRLRAEPYIEKLVKLEALRPPPFIFVKPEKD